MATLFYVSSVVALVAAALAVGRRNPFHGLLYVVASLLAVAVIFFSLGAPFAAALEIIVYAGAIIVLFVFVVMMLNLRSSEDRPAYALMSPAMWVGPGALALVLLVELAVVLAGGGTATAADGAVGPKEVSAALFGSYALGVELASFLLLAGLVGAAYLGAGIRTRGGDR
jgi:NADH-quinone oxidoreductase subunit J